MVVQQATFFYYHTLLYLNFGLIIVKALTAIFQQL
jgi:hypothetical protein